MKIAARGFLLLLFIASAFAALLIANDQHLDQVLQAPSAVHWAGTDSLGRDLLIRILQGNFLSWTVGAVASGIALAIGATLGAWAGWSRTRGDFVLMRLFEIWNSFPSLILVTLLVLAFSPVAENSSVLRILALALAIGLTHWVPFARLARALVLQESSASYIEGAIAIGASTPRILWRHLRPHLTPSLRESFWIHLPSCLLFEGLVSFLGFGLQSPQTSLGSLLNDGWKTFSAAPFLLLAPGFLLFATLLGFQLAFPERVIAPEN